MSTDLDTQVRDLLQQRRGDWPAIAAASDVSYSWLSKFVNEHIPNPGFVTLKKLHTVLTAPAPAPEPATPTGA